MFNMKFRLMAPEGDATGGGGTDFLGSMAGGSGEPAAAGQADSTPPAGSQGGAQATPDLPGWGSSVTKELRTDPRFADFAKRYTKLDDVVKSAMDLTAKAGEIPQKPEDYELELDKDLQFEESELAEYKALAHKLGLTKQQAAELHKVAAGTAKTQLAAYQEKQQAEAKAAKEKAQADYKATDEAIRKEWGQNYQANYEIATRGLKAYASPELLKALQAAQLGNNPEIVRHFYQLGKMTREDSALYKSGNKTRERSIEDIMYPSTN